MPAVETMRDPVFVVCSAFDYSRQSPLRDVIRDTSEQLTAARTTPALTEVVLQITSALFYDSAEVWWPQYTSTMPRLQQTGDFPNTPPIALTGHI